jgi:hypothetical protein
MLRFLGVWQLKKAIASKSTIPAIAAFSVSPKRKVQTRH